MKSSNMWLIIAVLLLVLAGLKLADYLPFYSCIIICNIWKSKGE